MNDRTRDAMRSIRAKADRYLAKAVQLNPPGGTIAAGGAHFDAFLRGEGLSEFLSQLGKGKTPAVAAEIAKQGMSEAVRIWNSRRPKEYQVHRWSQSGQDVIDDAMRAMAMTYEQSEFDAKI